ncbi:unnamed protein product [Ambrosiozyma monospora]|uniref:Unnamed protein product n=1 Tax=Ambrosiozyma monospora TaxID=43982 RepID=A0A9W6Z806_AMBMO|nr:unnamed protein product [Ambrosiozyma monospora]
MAVKDTLTKLVPKRKNRPQLGRRTSTFIQVKESIGYRLRKIIYRIEDILGPIVNRLIPNFIVAHYVYIVTLVLLGSILMYPVKNIKYIDALFFAAGACTQAGLNTINVNQLDLYQQIVIYIICMFTTPIFINSTVTMARLFWFEKSFDHIKETSKQNFKMRRSQTLAAFRTMTISNTRTNSMMPNRTATLGYNRNQNGNGGADNNGNVHFDTHNASEDLSSRLHKYQAAYSSEIGKDSKLDDVLEGVEQTTIQASSSSHTSPGSKATGNGGFTEGGHHDDEDDVELDELDANDDEDDEEDEDDDNNDDYDDNEDNNVNGEGNEDNFDAQRYNAVVHYSEPSDEGDDDDEDESRPIKADQKDIKFADLPKPSQTQAALRKRRGRRTKDINPRDLYMSISMMQHNQQQQEQQQRQQQRQQLRQQLRKQRNQQRQRIEMENLTNNAGDVPDDTTEGQAKSQSESGSGMLGVGGLGVGKVRLPGHHHKHRKHRKRKKREQEKLKLQKEIQNEIIEQGLNEAGVHLNGSRIQVDGVEGSFHNTVDGNGGGNGNGNETGGGNGSFTILGLPRRKTPAVLHTVKDFQGDDEENDSAVSAEFDSEPEDHWASSTSDDETATESDDDYDDAVESVEYGNNGRGYLYSRRGQHPRRLSANMKGINSDPGNGMMSAEDIPLMGTFMI